MSDETPHDPATPSEVAEDVATELPQASADPAATPEALGSTDPQPGETPSETVESPEAGEIPVETPADAAATADEIPPETPDAPADAAATADETPADAPADAAATTDETPPETPAAPADATTRADEPPAIQEEPPASPAPRPAAPSPAALAARLAGARPAVQVPPVHSDSARFGRVAEDGTVYVVTGEEERAVGSYPGAGSEEALQYFARKYDEVFGMAELLEQRLAGAGDLTAKDAADQLTHLTDQMSEPAFVGDLAALQAKLDRISGAVERRREEESASRAAAKAAAATERESLVARAEAIAAQDPAKVQWKRSGEELRTLFEEWKTHQRSGVKLDKPVEAGLWQRFSAARTSFDKARRTHFAELESTHSEAKQAKERLVKEAEQLSTSKDWGPTAREFKRLMDRWRVAGRAGRADDDALWARFKAAQDAFFTAKDAVVAAEDEEFRANLAVKEELLAEADALLPVTDLEAAKAALRSIQDRWEKAGKVPRGDMERTEKGLRRVEQAVRELEDRKWSSSNPEARARAQSLVDQLEKAVAGLESDVAAAEEKGNEKKVAEARAALEARRAWLDQARAGLTEFS